MSIATLSYLLMTMLMLSGLFLIALILIQRGRGGGLISAFGGRGGDSFVGVNGLSFVTKLTCVVVVVWLLLSGGSVVALHHSGRVTDESIFAQQAESDAAQQNAGPTTNK